MSAKAKSKLPIFIGIAVGLGILFLIILFIQGGSGKNLLSGKSQKIEIQDGSNTLIVSADGQVELRNGDGSYYDTWSQDKTDAFFEYFETRYKSQAGQENIDGDYIAFFVSGNKVYTTIGGDELVPVVIDDAGTQDDGGSGGGGGSEDVSNYFNNTPAPSGGSVNPTNPPSSGGSSDGACKYWRISYCVEFRTITPVITPTPAGSSRVLPPDCGDTGNKVTGRTVIGNELCVVTPSPTPQ